MCNNMYYNNVVRSDAPAPPIYYGNALATGVVGGLIGAAVYGMDSQLSVPGLGPQQAAVGFGVHSALSSVLSQYVTPMVLPKLEQSVIPTSWDASAEMYGIAIGSGVSSMLLHQLAGNDRVSQLSRLGIGAASQYIGDMVVPRK